MSRATSKAQADKGKAPARVSPLPNHEHEEEDIIPGCLTQSQWIDMLVQEEAEDVVGEIMADVMTNVMEACYNVHIERQLPSFTAYWAKCFFTQTVERKIICRDRGEDPMALSATEDSEPIPITPDVWAEGCFPVIHGILSSDSASVSTQINQETNTSADFELAHLEENLQSDTSPEISTPPEMSEGKISPCEHVSDKEPSPSPKPNISTKKKQKASLPAKLPRSTVLQHEEKTKTSDNRSTQPPKDTKTILKVNQSSLPQRLITPQYEIDKHTKSSIKPSSGQPKLRPLPSKQQIATTGACWKPDQPERLSPIKDERMMARALRMDTISLAKGVCLKDPWRTQMGPHQFKSQAQFAKLRPINSESVKPEFPVDELTTGCPPQVTQILPLDKFKF
ncbi:uncharacterized protein C2orf81 homolog [Corythoichthys intestinalis]|uniref:uncharacterized protein C2orf81 homolog n=1 Tax=Corythoichthys intestinalis TaxID=161448 RepID=UPI0025A5ED60|nr:uncharacterized protein C2orf81 homolog [Corythoichthys intestinalis]XP_057688524.1 uncharacterized protein C2orf81 homolog [Corythoichthys intestinalis]